MPLRSKADSWNALGAGEDRAVQDGITAQLRQILEQAHLSGSELRTPAAQAQLRGAVEARIPLMPATVQAAYSATGEPATPATVSPGPVVLLYDSAIRVSRAGASQRCRFQISLYLEPPRKVLASTAIDVNQLVFSKFTEDLKQEFGYDDLQDEILWRDPAETAEGPPPANTIRGQNTWVREPHPPPPLLPVSSNNQDDLGSKRGQAGDSASERHPKRPSVCHRGSDSKSPTEDPTADEGREENTGPAVEARATGPSDNPGGWDIGHGPRRTSDASDTGDIGGEIAGDANSSQDHESPSPQPAARDPPEVIEIGSDTDYDASELFEEAGLVDQEERLRQFQEALKIDQYTAERWAECRRFYQIAEDSQLGDRPSDLIPLRGLKRPLLPHQAFAVWWILHSETTTGTGGFEADDMGIGKTLIAQATVVVARWVMRATEAVQQARATSGATHLAATNVDPRRRCPSAGRNPYPICCPCEFGSPTGRLQPSCGLQLFMVPPKLMVHWVKEWTLNVDTTVVDLELLLGYNPAHAALRGVGYRFVSQLDDSQKALLQYREAQVWGHAAGLQRYTAATGETLQREQQAHLEDIRRNQPLARPGQDRYVILTTPKSFQTQVVEPLAVRFSQARPRQRGPKGGLRAPQPPVRYFFRDTTIWSRAFRDECHEEKGRQTNSLRALRGLRGPTPRVGPSTDPADVAPTTPPAGVVHVGDPVRDLPGRSKRLPRGDRAAAMDRR
ncbi:hypothetical protein N7470_000632 [Penicillium chermesinum]|nr:hypothetical protein N7470_000632 [Penicillium chermesinum]